MTSSYRTGDSIRDSNVSHLSKTRNFLGVIKPIGSIIKSVD